MSFPDQVYLSQLIEHLDAKVKASQTAEERLLMLSSASMNWIADYITDANVTWALETVAVDSLYLTGTNPVWNEIIIDKLNRSIPDLRTLLKDDPEVVRVFADVVFTPVPILIREEDGKPKVLDGMHRTIAAIRDNVDTIQAYVARPTGPLGPQVEAHVVYDILKSYIRGYTTDRAGVVAALRCLRGAYSNVDNLLRERFQAGWLPSGEIQSIIAEALSDNSEA